MARTQGSSVYYKFTDASGRVHIVDTLDGVPQTQRGSVERIEMASAVNGASGAHYPSGAHYAGGVVWPSFALGFASALVLVLLVLCFRGSFRTTMKLALAMALLGALVLGYFGWVARQVDPHAPFFATPGSFVDEARRGAAGFEQAKQKQEQELRRIEQAR